MKTLDRIPGFLLRVILGAACVLASIGCGTPEPESANSTLARRGKTEFLNPADHRSFADRASPEALGEQRGQINMLAGDDPLLPEYRLHGVQWPMVANAGSSRVYPPQQGLASYYWEDDETATGEAFDPSGMTAAHIALPFGTLVRCTRRDTGASVTVTINDRGPYVKGRIIDLSKEAARRIGMHEDGVTEVVLDVLAYPLVELAGPKGNG